MDSIKVGLVLLALILILNRIGNIVQNTNTGQESESSVKDEDFPECIDHGDRTGVPENRTKDISSLVGGVRGKAQPQTLLAEECWSLPCKIYV
jgi:hypothetical protein